MRTNQPLFISVMSDIFQGLYSLARFIARNLRTSARRLPNEVKITVAKNNRIVAFNINDLSRPRRLRKLTSIMIYK